MIRVGVYLGTEPHAGGAFQYGQTLLDTLAGLQRSEFDVLCAYAVDDWAAPIARHGFGALRVSYARAHSLYDRVLRNAGLSPRLWRAVVPLISTTARRLLASARDIWIFPAQDGLSYQLPVRSLVTIFDLMHRYERRFPEVSARGRAWRRDVHYRLIAQWSTGILVDAEVGRDHVVDSYDVDPRRVFVLPPAPPERPDTPGSPALPELPAKFWFYPAQFWEHKNHERLLQALAAAARHAPDMALVLAGSPKNAYARVRAVIAALALETRVVTLGYVPDALMPALYRRARGLVMPTFFGPTNIPPFEAFQFGCPVACSRVYAMPEQFGDAAIYFDPRSVEEMTQALLRIWQDDELCAALAARGRQRLAEWPLERRAGRLAEALRAAVAA